MTLASILRQSRERLLREVEREIVRLKRQAKKRTADGLAVHINALRGLAQRYRDARATRVIK